jgi:hypothetical protein
MKEREIVASDLQRSGYTQLLIQVADCNGVTGCLNGDHQYVALRRQRVVRWADSVHGKHTYYERKGRKSVTDQHDDDQQQTEKGLTIGHLECTIFVQSPDQEVFVL